MGHRRTPEPRPTTDARSAPTRTPTPMAFWSNPLRPRSIRGQLVVLTTALAVPLVALQVWWGVQQFREAEAAADSEALILADATATSVRQSVALTRDVLTAVAASAGPGWMAGEACGPAVLLPNVFSHLANLIVIRADGEIVCSTIPPPDGVTTLEWDWLPELRSTGRFTIGAPIFGTMSETWLLPLAAPILGEDGSVLGAVAGSLPLLEFRPFLDGVEIDDEQLVTIATADRFVVARSHDAERWIGQPLPPANPGQDWEVAPGRAVARGVDLDGVMRAWGQVEMDYGWTVYVGIPSASIVGPARADFGRNLAMTLIFVLLAIGLAGTSYRRIGAALRKLSSSTSLDADGDRTELPEGTPEEVRHVVARFDESLRSRRRAEAAERAARERFQSIFDNAVFGLYVSTMDGRFLQVNPALASMLGYDSPTALIEVGPRALYPAPGVREELIETALEHGTVDGWEIDWLRADGRPITLRLSGRVIEVDGETAFEMIVQDITEEKRRESELRQTQKMEAIGKLAGGIAHDFNNLLTVIGGNLELMEDALADDDPLRVDVDQIREATQRASTLTTQVLTFARREPRGARPVSLNEVLTNMDSLLARLIGEDVRLETRLASDPPLILIDPSELEQVVMNLALNARDAMPSGGTILIETRRAPLRIGPGGDGTRHEGVLLSVRDTGVGMDLETSKRIFEPFYTTKPVGQGTGLGLSTVYGIVQRADGQIGVESDPGRGTTIEVWFPLARGEVEDRTEPATSPIREGGDESVLVVEDEELVRKFVRRALQAAGYDVVVATDGQEALEMFQSESLDVDLVLTDVVMPRLRGHELAERLETIAPQVPVLYMSGYVHSGALTDRLGSDPDILLRKPFSATELCQRVRLALDRRYAARPEG